MKIILSLFFILFIVSGCVSKKRVVAEHKEYPHWYEKPLKTSSSTLYAVGEGENKRMAINNALNEILATLSVSVSSKFNSKTQITKGDKESYSVTSSNEIYSEVQKIQINNYELLNTNNFGFEKYLVQVKVDKQKFFNGLLAEVEQKFHNIEFKDTSKLNSIEKLVYYKTELASLHSIENNLRVIYSLNSTFDESFYLQKIADLQNKHDSLLAKISFRVDTNKDAKRLKAPLEKGLSTAKYKINRANSKHHFRVYISSNTSRAKSYGFDLARSAISIRVKDYRGNIIGSNKLNITGQSTQGNKIAKENVAMKLNILIKREGITKILGLHL